MLRRIDVITPEGRKLGFSPIFWEDCHFSQDERDEIFDLLNGWLPIPRLRCKTRKIQFWFTEEGWREFMKTFFIWSIILPPGFRVVVQEIEDIPGNVVYRDRYQIAVKKRGKKKGGDAID